MNNKSSRYDYYVTINLTFSQIEAISSTNKPSTLTPSQIIPPTETEVNKRNWITTMTPRQTHTSIKDINMSMMGSITTMPMSLTTIINTIVSMVVTTITIREVINISNVQISSQ
jgi:hypothetical protein